MAVIDSLPMPLSGGPGLAPSWLDYETVSRSTIWRHIRALRHQPPGRAQRGQRRKDFSAALEQAEQLFAGAETVGDASRPILLFYGLSQAGRAIAAASTDADNSQYRLSGHGITVVNVDQKPPLHKLIIRDEGKGSFTQLAPLLRSGTLPTGAALGDLWASIPSLIEHPLDHSAHPRPPLQFELWDDRDARTVLAERRQLHGWVSGLPKRLAAATDPGRAVGEYLGRYPALAESSQSVLTPDGFEPPDGRPSDTVTALRSWTLADPPDRVSIRRFMKDFQDSRTLPYLGDNDRWVFPRLDDDPVPLNPLLAWWALLFALSMLARYEPATWTHHLDVDSEPAAVRLSAALSMAMYRCPQLILHAIQAVGRA